MSFNSGGLPTDVWFTWSTSNPPIAPETLRISKPATPQNDTFSWALVNLACNTQYFFRGHAENASGAAPPSNIQTFTTASCDGGGGGTQDVDLFETTGDLEGGNGAGFVAAPDFYLTDDFPSSAHSGTHFAYLTQPDGYWGNNLSGGLISTSVEIPSDGDNLELEWWASISTNETLNGVFDTMTVYLVEPGNVQTEVMVLSNLQAGGGWKRYSRALASGWAGREVQVFFDAQTDASNTSVFRVDDIGLTATVPFGEEPTVSTGAADNITETSARLHLSVDAGGLPTEAWFDLEAGDDTPNDDTERFDVGSGTTTSNFQLSVGNLLCGTRYYYRPRAQNSEGSDRGSVRSFVTDSCSGTAPDADTDPADAITKTSAVLTADITPGGFPTTAYFRWGTTTSLLEQTSERPVGSGTSAVDFEEELSDLTCDTRYFFQAMAENSMGSDEGTIHSFRTLACGAPGDPESNLALMTQPLSCDGNTTSLMLRWNEVFDGGGTYTVRLEDGTEIATVDSATDGTRYLAQDELVQGSTFAAFVQAEGVANTERSNVIRMPILSRICEQPASDRHVPRRFTAWSPRTFCEAGEVKVEIAWALSINADTYAIRRASPSVSGATNYDGLTGLSFTDTVDTADAYRYSVTAHNAFGVASSFLFSVAVPENVCDPGAPAASIPISISAPYCDGNRERVDVTWSSVSGETHSYRLLTGGFFNLGAGMDLDPGAGTVAADIRWGRATGVTILSQPEDGSLRRMSRQLGAYIAANACDNPELAPQASTHDSVWSSADSTFLSGSVNPNGSVSDYFFEWGTSAAYGEETPRVDVGVGADFVIVGHALNGLQCETTYHYRIVSENLHGPSVGSDKVLETGSCPVNEAPVAAEDNYQVDEDQILVISAPGVLANDSDPNGDPMQAMLVALPEHGEVTLEIDGSFTYTPDPEFSGEDSFSYLASDGFLTSVEAVVDIVVAPVNDPPAISVVEPNGVGDSADLSFVIAWTDEDVDSGALVELWYSLDATCFAPTFLAGPFPEDDLEDVYTWNTASLPEGDYWILARISDGIAPIAEFCSEGPVSVTHSISLLFADGFESGSLSRWSETVGGAGLVLLSDDFSDGTLDDTIWSWSGNSVIEESGILALTADVTDQYGIIDSAVIGVDMDRTLLVERDVRHHFASDRFMGWLQIFSDDDPSFGLSVFYGNMTFFNGTLCPVERTVLTKQRTSPHVCAHVGGPNIGPELAPIWDTWYRERIEFEPSTGDVRYYIDDALEATWLADPLPTMDGVGHIQIRMVPWGWFTGHEQLVDNFVVSQP